MLNSRLYNYSLANQGSRAKREVLNSRIYNYSLANQGSRAKREVLTSLKPKIYPPRRGEPTLGSNLKSKTGFTLIEILIVIAIIAILAGTIIIAINPARQFATARNTQRWTAVSSILNAVHQNMIDNEGTFDFSDCGADSMPSSATAIKKTEGVDLCACLIDTYIVALPADPTDGTPKGSVTDCTASYDTGYTIYEDAISGRITVAAPSAELEETISVTR